MRFPRNRDVTVKPAVEAMAARLQTARGSKKKTQREALQKHARRTRSDVQVPRLP